MTSEAEREKLVRFKTKEQGVMVSKIWVVMVKIWVAKTMILVLCACVWLGFVVHFQLGGDGIAYCSDIHNIMVHVTMLSSLERYIFGYQPR